MFLVGLVCRFSDHAPFSWAFAGNTRPADAPNEAFYFWSSWLLSIAGLILIDLVLHDPAITRMAAIIVGIGDGLAEPIGTRFGKYIYKPPGFWKFRSPRRSLEGSAAVCLGAFLSFIGATWFEAGFDTPKMLAAGSAVAVGTTIVEAVTPHGLDNLTIAITVAGLMISVNYVF